MNVVANDPERTQGKNVIQLEKKTFKQRDNSNADTEQTFQKKM